MGGAEDEGDSYTATSQIVSLSRRGKKRIRWLFQQLHERDEWKKRR